MPHIKCFLTGSEYNRNLLGGKWALMDFQCALESDVKVRNCSSLGDLLKILPAEVSEPVK